ncbi:N-substituted formamide deformylase precursor [Legionella massiliensis]|uniref:N-substituted formamide deformylase n=1 Tax=Legionella massiliensis TaxID=1034943 RepID=A0A078KQ37_9GAMM|nr:amidohydrolase [Legionella massiliensis]CDZ76480.1 N-substituted formamide deformylase precursor [Legionella massiliensis]CEE12218.1 N-substituted formamide deformylase precursor [Legionella massiliensis]
MDAIYFNGLFKGPGINGKTVTAAAINNQRFVAFGLDKEIFQLKTEATRLIDLHKKVVIPGLNDSHIHLIRGGLSFNMELRWDGIHSLSDALLMLKEQAARTPAPQWVRVVGGWTEFQFKERRMPTLAEINAVSPDTPVFLLHLYDRALLNQAALRAIGYDKNTKELPGTFIERDKAGNPTGMLIAHPNAIILYSALAQGPKLDKSDQINSTLHFMRELNRLGITSVVDAGGGFQNYPEDYEIINNLDKENKLSVRIAYNLFTQNPGKELKDFEHWTQTTHYQQGNDYYRLNGAGEMLVFSAADFEDFQQPRPDLAASMETELKPVVQLLAESKWPFRLHATYNESIERALNVFEQVHNEVPIDKLQWFFDHAETISDQSIERVKQLGGGIAIQNRMAFQGEYFIARYGDKKTQYTPPIRKILEAGIPVGLGTDATRVSSYNPWLCLYWLTTGKSVGGATLYQDDNILSREKALELYTKGSAWFSKEEANKGSFLPNQLADFAVLSKDFFQVPDEEIKSIYSLMTVVGGKPVHASDEFSSYNPQLPPVSPSWSPIKYYGTYGGDKVITSMPMTSHHQHHESCQSHSHHWMDSFSFGGCFCWAF